MVEGADAGQVLLPRLQASRLRMRLLSAESLSVLPGSLLVNLRRLLLLPPRSLLPWSQLLLLQSAPSNALTLLLLITKVAAETKVAAAPTPATTALLTADGSKACPA